MLGIQIARWFFATLLVLAARSPSSTSRDGVGGAPGRARLLLLPVVVTRCVSPRPRAQGEIAPCVVDPLLPLVTLSPPLCHPSETFPDRTWRPWWPFAAELSPAQRFEALVLHSSTWSRSSTSAGRCSTDGCAVLFGYGADSLSESRRTCGSRGCRSRTTRCQRAATRWAAGALSEHPHRRALLHAEMTTPPAATPPARLG